MENDKNGSMVIGKPVLVKIRRSVNGNIWDPLRIEIKELIGDSKYSSIDNLLRGRVYDTVVEIIYYSLYGPLWL